MRFVSTLLLGLLFVVACSGLREIAIEPMAEPEVVGEQGVMPTNPPAPTEMPEPTATLELEAEAVEGSPGASQAEPIVVTEEATHLPVIVQEPVPVLANEIAVEFVTDQVTRPVFLTHAGDERLFVIEKAGRIVIVENGAVTATYLDIRQRVNDEAYEQGLLSAVFHPDFAENGRLFVYYTDASDAVVISEFSASGANSADPNSERIMMTVAQPYENHNGGQLHFGHDGYLYIGLGDGGSGGDPLGHGQNRETLLGNLLRIDVDAAGAYGIPTDNPFVNDSGARDEIWAWGLRNPWRFSFDARTGDLYIADVGQNQWEEVNFELADSAGGLNYGWNEFEGNHCYRNGCSLPDAIMPVVEYDHSEGCSITGGYVYRGTQFADLYGNYVYGDYCTATIWTTLQTANGVWEVASVYQFPGTISSFGEGADRELYVVSDGGSIYRIVAP